MKTTARPWVLGLSIVALAWAVLWMVPTFLAGAARQDYNAALARWRSQGVTQYEMMVRGGFFGTGAGHYWLKVNVAAGTEEVVDYTDADYHPAAHCQRCKPDKDTMDSLASVYTVGELFHSVDQMLQNGQMAPGFSNQSTRCRATFNSTLGYPEDILCESPPMVADGGGDIRVESLTVLARAGTPSK